MGRPPKNKEEVSEVTNESDVTSKSQLSSILKEHKKEHFNHEKRVNWKVSTGSLLLDVAMEGGISPSLIRLAGANNEGKAQPVWAKVLTSNGWKNIGDIRPNDTVYGSDGRLKIVKSVHPQGIKDIYKITTNDNCVTHCCLDHFWYTKTHTERQKNGEWVLRDLKEIKESLQIRNKHKILNHSIPNSPIIHFDKPKNDDLYIHPYVLGCLLGGGSFGITELSLTNSDENIIKRFIKLLPKGVKVVKHLGTRTPSYRLYDRGSFIKKTIQELGLWGKNCYDKFVPSSYLFNSYESRLELLKGLLDTYGSVMTNYFGKSEFSTSSPILADNVEFLSKTLGATVVRLSKDHPSYSYKNKKMFGRKHYILRITFHDKIIPFATPKKRNKYKTDVVRKHKLIKSISKNGRDECVCIKIDSDDGLYVTDDFILTHNTPEAIEMCRNIFNGVKNSKGLWVIAEGRGLSKENQERSGLKFVYTSDEWDVGTIFVFETNVFELFIKTVKELVTNNTEDIKYVFVVDSIDGLQLRDDKSKDVTEANKVAGTPALSKKMLQSLSLGMFKYGHIMILISQVTAEIKLDKYSPSLNRGGQFSGGNSLLHASDYILEYQQTWPGDYLFDKPGGKLNDGSSKTIGKYCKIILQKSAQETSRKQLIRVPIKFGRKPSGIWLEYECVDMLLAFGLLEQSSSWLVWSPDLYRELQAIDKDVPEKIQGIDRTRQYLELNPPITNFLIEKFKSTLI
jgi:hypothetical protein